MSVKGQTVSVQIFVTKKIDASWKLPLFLMNKNVAFSGASVSELYHLRK